MAGERAGPRLQLLLAIQLSDIAEREERARMSILHARLNPPLFSKPGDHRKLRLLSAIALGLARTGVKSRKWSGQHATIHVGADSGFPSAS
jgi:hypothetical protein